LTSSVDAMPLDKASKSFYGFDKSRCLEVADPMNPICNGHIGNVAGLLPVFHLPIIIIIIIIITPWP
jgi:hypothetical protein